MFGTDKIGCYGCLQSQVTSSMLAHWFKRRHLKSKIWIQPIRHTYGMGMRLCELSRGTVLHRRSIHSQTFTPAEKLSHYGVPVLKIVEWGNLKISSCWLHVFINLLPWDLWVWNWYYSRRLKWFSVLVHDEKVLESYLCACASPAVWTWGNENKYDANLICGWPCIVIQCG